MSKGIDNTTNLPKVEVKERAGKRLLNMLKKAQKEPELRPETGVTAEVPALVPFGDAVGCLAIHVKSCGDFSPEIGLSQFKSVMVRISVNNIVKSTKVCGLPPQSDEYNAMINFDELKYFSIQIPRRQDDKRNNISLELLKQAGKHSHLLGSAQIHLYNVIQKGYFTEEFEMIHKQNFICRLKVEFMFSYGNFGFGFSHQLQALRRVPAPSMFMTVAPPPERTDPVTNVITPQSIEYPAFLSPDLNVAVGKPSVVTQASYQPLVQLEKLKEPPRERLQRMKEEYRNLNSWMDKVDYLEKILNSKLEVKPKAIHRHEEHKTPLKKKIEDIITSDVPLLEKKNEITPNEKLYEDNLTLSPSKSYESEKGTYFPTFNIPNVIITEDKEIIPPAEYPSQEDMLYPKGEPLFCQSIEDTYPLKKPTFSSEVDFPLEEKDSSCLSPKSVTFSSTCSFQESNIQDGFVPFLRDINKKISLKKSKDQDMLKYRSSSYSDAVEHEDQDPPYPAQSKPEKPEKAWNQAPDIISIKDLYPKLGHDPDITRNTSDMENELAHESLYTTVKTLDDKNVLEGTQPNVSLSNFQGESSMTENVNVDCLPQSESLCLMSHMEDLKQSMVLKSILSKDLQDLSDELFAKPESITDIKVRKSSSLIVTVQDKPPGGLKDKTFDKSQDLDSCISEKNIPSSSLSCTNSPSKEESENIPLVEKEIVSEINIPAGEEDFPVKKKSSFKTKHLETEMSNSKSGLSDIVYDFDTKKIFIVPSYSSEIGVSNETQKQFPTEGKNLSSKILLHYKENEDKIELPQAKSIISQIIQAFPIDSLLECGIIKVVELDNEYHKKILLDSETVFAEENLKYSTEDSESFPEQNISFISQEATSSSNRIQFIGKGKNMSPQYSKYKSTPDTKTNLPSNSESFYRKENYIRYLEHLSNSLTGNLGESEIAIMSFLKAIFNVYFKYCQSGKRRPEKDLERLINRYFLTNTDFEEIKEKFDKVNKLDPEPLLSSNLCVFLEELSESEIKNLKTELSKHIQHYLIERLLESGHITKEDLPKIYHNLYLMNEKKEPKGQDIFLEKYLGTIKEVISFVNNFNRHFIDKHLEIKLRSFLTEILQNYFLKNFSENSLFKEIESEALHSNLSSLRTKSASISSHGIRQDIPRSSFGRSPEIKMKYPLSNSLQNYLKTLSENELLNIQANLSKRLYCLWIKKLSKSGLIKERQLESANIHMNLINPSATQLKSIKSDLSYKDENQSMKEHLENQDKYPEIVQNIKIPEDKLTERELIRKEESNPLNSVKENPSIIGEQKKNSTEEAKTLYLESQSSNNNSQVTALNTNSSERLTDTVLKKQRKEHGIPKNPRVENVGLKTEIQDPCSGSDKLKPAQSNACFERTLKTKSLDKKEHNNFCRLLIQRNTDAVLVAYPRIPSCKMSNEDKEYVNKCPFHSRQSNTTYCNSESVDKSKLDDHYYQRWKGNNNNNKKQPLVIIGQYKKDIQAIYPKVFENSSEKYAGFFESHPFKYKIMKADKSSKSFLFPEVLKTEHLKPKIRKERDHYGKQKKSFNKIGRILPNTMPTTRSLLRKSVPKTMLHWTARRTIHDCSDRFEELPENAFQHFEKAKPRARLLGKGPEDNRHHLKHSGRPFTAPEMNKRRDSYAGRRTYSRMSSTGSFQMNDLAPDYENHKIQQKKIRREC
ncbi:cation channel sperm-associated targeting subunit tau [Sorex fumeus]|uniref:cation channel sperm-associated targeting subunit tau n=1 Tax=Sorex fumeus TaxID=62283 RepID=UPI0024ADD028|nr:cation channel sperm-associated targeting subunit tau [Sorex fumeus]